MSQYPPPPGPQQNPFSTPNHGFQKPPGQMPPSQFNSGKLIAPAVFLLIIGILGLCASIFNVVAALVLPPQPVDPFASEFVSVHGSWVR